MEKSLESLGGFIMWKVIQKPGESAWNLYRDSKPWTLEHKAVTPSHEEVHEIADCITLLFNIVFFFLNSKVTFAFNCYFILKSRVNMGLTILK